jgi:hypothetical protein
VHHVPLAELRAQLLLELVDRGVDGVLILIVLILVVGRRVLGLLLVHALPDAEVPGDVRIAELALGVAIHIEPGQIELRPVVLLMLIGIGAQRAEIDLEVGGGVLLVRRLRGVGVDGVEVDLHLVRSRLLGVLSVVHIRGVSHRSILRRCLGSYREWGENARQQAQFISRRGPAAPSRTARRARPRIR